MALIIWNEQLSVNVKEMNQHHEKLVNLINDLHDAMRVGKSKEILSDILAKLLDYTRFHFTAEEDFMQKYGYPGLDQQKAQHQHFIKKIQDFQSDLNEGKLMLSMEIMNFLKDWLVKHIEAEDKKYGPFFNEKGLN